MSDETPLVKCKRRDIVTHLAVDKFHGNYYCPLCGYSDLTPDYYDNHEAVKDTFDLVDFDDMTSPASALDKQVDGHHYKTAIQPVEYIFKNKLDFLSGNVIKYVSRHRMKNGRKDIEKAIHYCQLILELEYNEKG